MSALSIRRYQSGDRERVQKLNRVAMRETPEWVPGAPDTDLADVPGHYLDGSGEFLVGEWEGDVVATGAYHALDDWMAEQFDDHAARAELTRLRVDPDFQGRGFGTRIVEALERRARQNGIRAFALNTGAKNDRARRFYEALGFTCVREASVEFEAIELDMAVYWRPLDD